METAVNTDIGVADRRRARRHHGLENHGVMSTQVRPGYRALLVNISAGGALIETHHRLLPGASVELVVERNHYRANVRGRVLRSAVVRLRQSSVWYRGAIGFDRCLSWFVEPERVDMTQPVI
jgi:hypothetical protein